MAAKRKSPAKKQKRASRPAQKPAFCVLLLPKSKIPLERPASEESGALLEREAYKWNYVVRNRRRWSGVARIARLQEERARDALRPMGIGDDELRDIATAGLLQVSMPWTRERPDWAGRILPWEFLLSAATRAIRDKHQTLSVIRRLEIADREPQTRKPASVLYVESAPGPLAGIYTFESERALVRAGLGEGIKWIEPLSNPTLDELEAAVRKHKPDVIHLAGFDSHQGMQVVENLQRRATREPSDDASQAGLRDLADGYILADLTGSPVSVKGEKLGEILCADGHRPLLVSCSFWNSGTRTCPYLVRAGASAAIGFQDAFDDSLIEEFFGSFYRHWSQGGTDPAAAFAAAFEPLRNRQTSITGSGVLFWHERALLEGSKPVAVEDVAVLEPDETELRSTVRVVAAPVDALNYSLLHNKRPLFSRFDVLKLKPGRLNGVSVTIELHAGQAASPYRRMFDVVNDKEDLAPHVHAALTSELARSSREAVNTSLFVEVCWRTHVLLRDTYRVRLLPADQWRDDNKDRQWLPSFVFPRDPAVTSLVEKARRYVRVLCDSPAAGFDGYQSVDDSRDDPTEEVDLQVQALWAALVHEWQLGYINPPPTYGRPADLEDRSGSSQRLRTPSNVFSERAGTCIDLSLLFAACLELIDVYPVIFLLEGHAFPGYWRRDEEHRNFQQVKGSYVSEGAPAAATNASMLTDGWFIGADAYPEIVRLVDEGHLVPLESVMLTQHAGFWDAIEAGRENLRAPAEFHSMIDIVGARAEGVTPLPICEDVGR